MEKVNLRKILMECSKPVYKLEDNKWSKSFLISEDFIGFQGHFPDKPIMPGVMQVLISEVTVAEITGKNISLKEISQAKFTAPIDPKSNIECIVIQKAENSWDCTIMVEDVLSAKFRWQGEVQ